jgi:hypothetical protein
MKGRFNFRLKNGAPNSDSALWLPSLELADLEIGAPPN